MARGDVSDAEWSIIGVLLPSERGRKARPSHDNRRFLNGMLHVLRIGCPWRDMHERYAAGVMVMLGLKSLEARVRGPVALIAAIGTDLLIDGLVLGLAFIAGAQAGLLLTVGLTLEVLFLGVTVHEELGETVTSKTRIVLLTVGLALLMPLGSLLALPVAQFPPAVIAGFLSFGLIALLYLVTEELLVEAHQKPYSPLISAMFFIGFLGLLLLEELM